MVFGVHPAEGRALRPWRNGGGRTTEVLASPEAAGPDDFGWRISLARVEQPGPFSAFPGVARALAVIEGGALSLRLGEQDLRLGPASDPVAFPGDLPCHASPDDMPVLVLNVMTRDPWRAQLDRLPVGVEAPPVSGDGQSFALLLAAGAGLRRLDLVDLHRLAPEWRQELRGTPAVGITLSTG